jgi:hypothetical protein
MRHSNKSGYATMTRLLAAAILWLAGAQAAAAAGLTVAWDPNVEPEVATYLVQYGTASGSTAGSVMVTGSVSRVRLENLNPGTRYYVRVRAVGSGGAQSAPSAEVSGVASDAVPAPPAGSAQTCPS